MLFADMTRDALHPSEERAQGTGSMHLSKAALLCWKLCKTLLQTPFASEGPAGLPPPSEVHYNEASKTDLVLFAMSEQSESCGGRGPA